MKRVMAIAFSLVLVSCGSGEQPSEGAAQIDSTAPTESTNAAVSGADSTESTVSTIAQSTEESSTTVPEPMHKYGPFVDGSSTEEAVSAEQVVNSFVRVIREVGSDFYLAQPPARQETAENRDGDAAVVEQCSAPHVGRYQLRALLTPFGDNYDLSVTDFDDVEAVIASDSEYGSGIIATNLELVDSNSILIESFCFERSLLPDVDEGSGYPDDWDWDWSSLEPCCQTSLIPPELHESTVHIDDLDLSLFITGDSEPRTWVFSTYEGYEVVDDDIVLNLAELGLIGACDVMAQRKVDAGFISSIDPDFTCLSDREEGAYEMSVVIPLERIRQDLAGKSVLLQLDKLMRPGWFDFDEVPSEQFVDILQYGADYLPPLATRILPGQLQIKFIVDALGTAHISALSAYPTP